MRQPMSASTFYLGSSLLPFVIAGILAIVWAVASIGGPAEAPFVRAAQLLAVVYAYAILPYGALLALTWVLTNRVSSAPAPRSVMWAFPVVLAAAVTLLVFIGDLRARGSMPGFVKPVAWGVGAAMVGYVHVVVIELGFTIARRAGLVRA